MNSRTLASVSGHTRFPARRRFTSSLLSAARFPKYAGPIPVSARKASISRRRV